MPIGPNGEKRPKNPNAAAVMVGKIATGRMEEQYVDGAVAGKSNDGGSTDPKTTPSETGPKS